jgi:hypothetical protein
MQVASRATTTIILCVLLALSSSSCAPKRAISSEEAISTANSMDTSQEKIDYLIPHAQTFYDSGRYREAIETAQYILKNLDNDSQEARKILARIRKEAEVSAQEVKETLEQESE